MDKVRLFIVVAVLIPAVLFCQEQEEEQEQKLEQQEEQTQKQHTEEKERVVQSLFDEMSVTGLYDGVPYYSMNNHAAQKKVVYGNQFLNEEFVEGIVLGKDGEKFRIKARYDAYNDEIQYYSESGRLRAILPDLVKAVGIGDNIFVPKEYKVDKRSETRFFQLLVEGDMSLFVKHKAVKRTVRNNPLHAGSYSNEYRIEIEKSYFYQKKDKTLTSFKLNKKVLLKIMRSKEKMIRNFAAENNLRIKKEKDLALIFKKYNDQLPKPKKK